MVGHTLGVRREREVLCADIRRADAGVEPCDVVCGHFVRDVVNSCGLKNVTYYGFFNGVHYDNDSELGADWHPNYQAHKKIAYAIIPYIATATGWGLQDRIVE